MRMIRAIANISLVLTVATLSAVPTQSMQSTGRPDPRAATIQSNQQELDKLLLRKPILASEDKAARQSALKQINDDFKALQTLNNKIMAELTAPDRINYKSVANWISELNSRASRLKSSLVLPKAEDETARTSRDASSVAGFAERLKELDKVVVSFANNQIFQTSNVIELELAQKASNDLATIVDQSARLKKAAAKLAKSSAPSPSP